MVDQQDRLGIPALLAATHARRVWGHSCEREANCLGSCLEQGNQGTHRDVAFNNVAVDQCGVTRARFDRNTHFCLECREIRILPVLDSRPVVLQVPDPLCAASSAGSFVDFDAYSGKITGGGRGGRGSRLGSAAGAADRTKNDQQCETGPGPDSHAIQHSSGITGQVCGVADRGLSI